MVFQFIPNQKSPDKCGGIDIKNNIVSNVKIYGLEDSVRASKYPFAINVEDCNYDITNTTVALGSCPTGAGEDTFLHGIIVQFDLTFTLKAWTEAQRYHFLEFVSSQSTQHRIMKFDIEKQCNEYVEPEAIELVQKLVDQYNEDKTHENYLKVLYNIPSGFKLTARMTTNYGQLKTIYYQRRNHRLDEWKEFCEWIETLPMFLELCMNRTWAENKGE